MHRGANFNNLITDKVIIKTVKKIYFPCIKLFEMLSILTEVICFSIEALLIIIYNFA